MKGKREHILITGGAGFVRQQPGSRTPSQGRADDPPAEAAGELPGSSVARFVSGPGALLQCGNARRLDVSPVSPVSGKV